VPISTEDMARYGADITFIGSFESDRYYQLMQLARQGLKIRVWGNGWSHCKRTVDTLIIEKKPLYDQAYQKAIMASKINLCFLRKINRDLHTSRSFEIPACGGFMLAERTEEHLNFFLDGKEAVFFENKNTNDLYHKCIYYLDHEKERRAIAIAGRQRCINSGYSHEDRLSLILKKVEELTI
jgi:spore maturation protein CgeB